MLITELVMNIVYFVQSTCIFQVVYYPTYGNDPVPYDPEGVLGAINSCLIVFLGTQVMLVDIIGLILCSLHRLTIICYKSLVSGEVSHSIGNTCAVARVGLLENF